MWERKSDINRAFEEYIMGYLGKGSDESKIFHYICENFHVILFGGAVRDFLFKSDVPPRDVDIVLDNAPANRVLLESFLFNNSLSNKAKVVKNQFGGYKIICQYKIFDIWFLENTWAFQNGCLKAAKENLLKSVYLNIDSYGYDWKEHLFLSDCQTNGIPKEIDIILEENPNILLNLIRAKAANKKYKIPLSDKIIRKIEYFKEMPNFEMKCDDEQFKHYGKIICKF